MSCAFWAVFATALIGEMCVWGLIAFMCNDKWDAMDTIKKSVRLRLIAYAVQAAIFLLCVAPYQGTWAWQPVKLHVDYQIYSITGTTAITTGGFAIGYGRIDTEIYYFFYSSEEDGLHLRSVEADKTTIVETNQYVPSLLEYADPWREPEYKMYVPTGTVQIEWRL
jgi:hypothetical protein